MHCLPLFVLCSFTNILCSQRELINIINNTRKLPPYSVCCGSSRAQIRQGCVNPYLFLIFANKQPIPNQLHRIKRTKQYLGHIRYIINSALKSMVFSGSILRRMFAKDMLFFTKLHYTDYLACNLKCFVQFPISLPMKIQIQNRMDCFPSKSLLV